MPGWPLGCCSVDLDLALVAQHQIEALLAVEDRHAPLAGIGGGVARNRHDGAQGIEHALEVLLAHGDDVWS